MSNEVLDRFLRYVKIHTTSDEANLEFPSAQREFDLANLLVTELKEIGINDAIVDEKCVVYGTLPSNLDAATSKSTPTICFNAHMDTATSESGENVNPKIHIFDGNDIIISTEPSIVIKANTIPNAEDLIGTEIVSADGKTLLGADDKAGIAEIMTMVNYFFKNPEIPHGEIKIVFSPDEEVGRGAKAVDVENLGADWAYTVDGSTLGELEYECFNAANGKIIIDGYDVHPGYAFNKMHNAIRALPEIIALFPDEVAPETTKDFEGYYHPLKIIGDVNQVSISFILRSFSSTELEEMINNIKNGVLKVQEKYSNLHIHEDIKLSYKNMKEIIEKHPQTIELARKAMEAANITPIEHAIRGGTDGAQFSYRGLPTPNLFTGGMNYHSKKEICMVKTMEKSVEVLINIVKFAID